MTSSKTLTKKGMPHFSVPRFQTQLLNWYSLNKASHPWRLDWEKNKDPYPIWISEIMLQQTTLTAMIPIFEKFMLRFPSLYSLSSASEEDIKKTVQGLGYYRRFSLLHKGAKKIVSESKRELQWPQSYTAWLEVPGVGDYTAAALSSITLNEAVPVLDGNVIRVLCRIFNIQKPSNDLSLKKDLKDLGFQLISSEKPGDFNQGLMELGQKLCRPSSPDCTNCPVQEHCLAFKKNTTHLAPQAKERRKSENVKLRIHILEHNKTYALIKRTAQAKFLKGTSGFLTECFDGKNFKVDGRKEHFKIQKGTLLGKIKHSITHHKIEAEVFILKKDSFTDSEWMEQKKLASHLVSSLDIKAWKLLQKHKVKPTD